MIKVLFVCMGNICRSPTAEGVFTKIVSEQGMGDLIAADSAGTHAYHVGEPPDPRAMKHALARDIEISHLRARRVTTDDFTEFDYVLAMDDDNYEILAQLCPAGMEHKLQLFMDYAPHVEFREVPDPYYGGTKGFERVLDMVEEASRGLVEAIRDRHK